MARAKVHLRAKAAEEVKQDEAQDLRLEQGVRKWKRVATLLGIALAMSIFAIVPFLSSHPYHAEWDRIGKKLVLLAMGLLSAFMYAAATAYNLWSYLRAIRSIHRRLAPPGSKHRTK